MADIAQSINATAIQNEINVVNVAMISLGAAVQDIAAIVSENFGQMTKKVNLFGTNVAKRLERIAAANKEIASSFGDMGKETGNGIEAATGSTVTAMKDIGGSLDGIGSGIGSVGDGIGKIGTSIGEVGKGLGAVGGAFESVGSGVNAMGDGVSKFGTGLLAAANGAATCVTVLPALGTAMLMMAANVSGITQYIPDLLVMTATLTAFSLLGEGLAAAGVGIQGISQGMLAMGDALPFVSEGMTLLIEQLTTTSVSLGGILTFVLLAASMFVMALALQKINENLAPMVQSLGTMGNIFSTGFVVGITVFTVMMALLALTLGKVASGMDKVTAAMDKQITKLGVLIPLQATSAILANPIVGGITVAAATAAGFVMKALVPQLATGGVAYGPTYAMIGEGRYPEAVIPLGDSPQFTSMKSDIANAVLQGLSAMNTGNTSSRSEEIVLNIDGERFARAILPKIDKERSRKGVIRIQE